MGNKRLATGLAITVAISMAIGAIVIFQWPDESLRLIDKAPIKGVLIALLWAVIVLIGAVLFQALYVPSLRMYCTTMGAFVVTALLISPVRDGLLPDSVRISYGDPKNQGSPHFEAELKMTNDNASFWPAISATLAAATSVASMAIYILIVWVENKCQMT